MYVYLDDKNWWMLGAALYAFAILFLALPPRSSVRLSFILSRNSWVSKLMNWSKQQIKTYSNGDTGNNGNGNANNKN